MAVKIGIRGTSLVVQWLRFCASTAGGVGSFPGQGRSHMLQGAAKKKKKGIRTLQNNRLTHEFISSSFKNLLK